PLLCSGFRLRAQTPAGRLKFPGVVVVLRDLCGLAGGVGGAAMRDPSRCSGFRLRAQTPAKRLKFPGVVVVLRDLCGLAGGVGCGYFVCQTRGCRFESCLECELKWSDGK